MSKKLAISCGVVFAILAVAVLGALPTAASTPVPVNGFSFSLASQGMGEKGEVHDNPAILPGNSAALESTLMAVVKSGSGYVKPDSVKLAVGDMEVVMTNPTTSEPILEYRSIFTDQLGEDGIIEVVGVGNPHYFTPRAAYRIDKLTSENVNGSVNYPALKAYALAGVDEKTTEIDVLLIPEQTSAQLILAASDVSDDGRMGALGYSVDGGTTWTDQLINGTDDEELYVWDAQITIPANTGKLLVRVQSIAGQQEGQSIYLSVAILNQEVPPPPTETPTPSPSPSPTPTVTPSPTPTEPPPPPNEDYNIFLPFLQRAKAPCTSRVLEVKVLESGMSGEMEFLPWPGNQYAGFPLPYGSHITFETSDGAPIKSSITWYHTDPRVPGKDGWYHYFPEQSEWVFTATFDSEESWEDLTPGEPWLLNFWYEDQGVVCNNSIPVQWDPPETANHEALMSVQVGVPLILK